MWFSQGRRRRAERGGWRSAIYPPSRVALVTCAHRAHHAAGCRSSAGCTRAPQAVQRQMGGDLVGYSDTATSEGQGIASSS